ncbi:FecCD family ABC transporter permease [Neisseria weixii]|uniref:FecCD family ABC transporter permease n=1 Tax=Neisseria weixii TaxID=1853276 RepID=UPI000BB73500|nr:iron chelate uptake ABC transporter family permease subunit [Neisseria weixii]ATD64660.1 iron ABC transporter permease [Neisseria weixii]
MKSLFLPLKRQRKIQTGLIIILAGLLVLSAIWGKQHFLLGNIADILSSTANPMQQWLFYDLWLPRTLTAAGAGAALGAAGAVFQSLTRNPLGSPDIIGVNAGAAVGAVAAGLLWPGYLGIAQDALLGALSVLVLVLLGTKGRLNFGMEIIVSGLAVNAAAMALVQFGLTAVRQENAQQMTAWLSGSLEARSWEHVVTVWTFMPLLLAGLMLLNTRLSLLALGRDTASGLGVPVRSSSWLLLLAATALAATAVTVAGPVSFLALAAPHIVRRMMQTDRPMVVPAALTGAVLMMAADLTARLLPTPAPLPAGIVTAALGGLYLVFLLSLKPKAV